MLSIGMCIVKIFWELGVTDQQVVKQEVAGFIGIQIRNEFNKILLLSETNRRLTCLIGDPSETSTCFIGDQHAWSETSTCFIWNQIAWSETHWKPRHATLETNMPDWRPIKDLDMLYLRPTCQIGGNRHAWLETHQRPKHATLETNMPVWRPIGDLDMLHSHAWLETHQRPTCPIGNWNFPSKTDMPDWKPIGDLDMLHWKPTYLIGDPSETNMPHW